jgi:hypothetical protein
MHLSDVKSHAVHVLRQADVLNPLRLLSLIRKQISFLQLDLSGLTVLTEAASGPYVVTPVIASLAGAKRVLAVTQDSRYATSDNVIMQTRALEVMCEAATTIEIHKKRPLDLFSQADIITNLGFVRPLNRDAILAMKDTAVIPLMCEAWELRPGDVEFEVCLARNIPVVGTNEDFPGLEVFSYSGFLCAKMLFEAQVEIHKSTVMVVSSDKFGRVIARYLSDSGAYVELVDGLGKLPPKELSGLDALIVADYTRPDTIIGRDGDISSESFASYASGITVVQFAGKIDVDDLILQGVNVYPGTKSDAHRMARTLGYLGPRPVVELHAAGLKVGELILKQRGVLPKHPNDKQYDSLCMPLA